MRRSEHTDARQRFPFTIKGDKAQKRVIFTAWNGTYYSMNKPWQCYAKCNKHVLKTFTIYLKVSEQATPSSQQGDEEFQGMGWGRLEKRAVTAKSYGVSFWSNKVCQAGCWRWRHRSVVTHSLRIYLKGVHFIRYETIELFPLSRWTLRCVDDTPKKLLSLKMKGKENTVLGSSVKGVWKHLSLSLYT